jgi:IclR family acetate operon transcriptional repressor
MPGHLQRELGSIRRKGIAFEREESSLGVVCVASPLLDEDGIAVAALSITGWSNRLNTTRVAAAVQTAALTIARQLRAAGGGRPPAVRHAAPE